MTLPNCFVIGAQKAGTSSVYRYLDQHPDVYMSPVKEPGFFVYATDLPPSTRHPQHITNWADYRALFADVAGERVVGEASTGYLTDLSVPGNIRTWVPDARLIAVLRNPVDRAFSAYSMRVGAGKERRPFAEVIDDDFAEVPGRWRYLGPGRYGEQLARYYDTFPAEQIQVHLYEDLSRDTPAVMRRVFEFLGVDPDREVDAGRHNVGRYRAPVPTGGTLRRVPGRAMVRKVVPAGLWQRAGAAYHRRTSRPLELPDAVRDRLLDYYRDDIALAARLLDRDLSAWTAGA